MSVNSVNILLIEDNPAEARLLQELLKQAPYARFTWTCQSRLQAAIAILEEQSFDVILLDLTLPDSQGLESLSAIARIRPQVPIVVLTNTDDDDLALEAMRSGAQDYLFKRQANTELLARSVRYAIERKQASEAVRQAKEELEQRVQERTAELALTNQHLQREIGDRLRIQQALVREKELAQVTLHSIGDAVIATDALGRIQSLNPVAETLTGWQSCAAQGHSLDTVLRLWDEATHTPVQDLLEQVLREGIALDPSERRLVGANETQEFFVELSAAPIRLDDGKIVGGVLVCRDVTPARSLAQQLSWQARHDALTGLPNRREFEHRLEGAIAQSRNNQTTHVLCYLDLDRFKLVNDTCGHMAGDELLRHMSALLQRHTPKADLLARLGGDEFALLLHHCDLDDAQRQVQELIERIGAFRFIWEDSTFTVGVSVGLVEINADTDSWAHVLSAADTAMYAAKDAGRNRLQIYQPDDLDIAQRHGDMQWVSRIVKALEEDRFCLYAQAIIPADPQRRSRDRYEILLRLEDEDGNIVTPGAFMPAAERYDLMPAIDRWVVRQLFSQLHHLPEQRNQPKPLYMVNLSGASFNDERFLTFLREQFWLHHIPPSMICFEITETVAISNINQAVQFIYQLKQLGCCFALDDFGSGMSSLNYLKNLPVDYLKIDGHFIRNVEHDAIDAATIEAINHMGHVMGLQTIAEFVENPAILQKVQHLGVDFVQGYGIAKPEPLTLPKSIPSRKRHRQRNSHRAIAPQSLKPVEAAQLPQLTTSGYSNLRGIRDSVAPTEG
ncbi:EAL domain-containing protein [Geitlerinema sp. P-1104]|uniref:EAL domain-containing protein n=1 Tax=Geitlerinema sp. P-1104 TaxID=2546230 RepID=UPI00147699C2|nr:EAL domain-containing protein [Geitlerinema sp. P-1104]NMG57798.1 EAL domain-containing protein [Geitlerinema sp. P-1104]